MFRHEKRFFNKPGLFCRLRDNMPIGELKSRALEIADYTVEYVGMELKVDGFAIEATSDGQAFAAAVRAALDTAPRPLVLIADDAEVMAEGVKAAAAAESDDPSAEVRPLIYGATAETWEAFADLAAEYNCPMAIREEYLDVLSALAVQIQDAGVKDVVLDHGARDLPVALAKQTHMRRLALKKNFRPLGYPQIAFPGDSVDEPSMAPLAAAQAIAKYAGFIVLDDFSPATVYPLLALRENLYTDPQTPIQVQPGVYELNDPTPDAPLFVTTNFSITYFAVANEISGSGHPGWLLVVDSEGMSVLTAWAAGKFDAERIAKAVKANELAEKLNHKKLVIPGHVSILLGEIEEELPGWQILVGPREAVDIPSYYTVWEAV
jgi:acetyl-CoA decarbonylase/synthase complex subunit gamma